ncbi:hypothetical protein AABB24_028060, partial [Solanum stoloniferum]
KYLYFKYPSVKLSILLFVRIRKLALSNPNEVEAIVDVDSKVDIVISMAGPLLHDSYSFVGLYLVIDNPIPADNRLTLEKLLFSSPTLETLCLGQFELEL